MKKEIYYNWLFHYNPYQKKWYAFEKDNFIGFFSDKENTFHVKGSSMPDLIKAINKLNG
jgi:hypothetical protein